MPPRLAIQAQTLDPKLVKLDTKSLGYFNPHNRINGASTEITCGKQSNKEFLHPMDMNNRNPIGYLQEIYQAEGLLPEYKTLLTTGPSHSPTHIVQVEIKEYKEIGNGISKKEAKANAAKKVLAKINEKHNLHHTSACNEPNCFYRRHETSSCCDVYRNNPTTSGTTNTKGSEQSKSNITKTMPESDELTITIKFKQNEQRK